MQRGLKEIGKERGGILLEWGIRFFLAGALSAAQLPAGYAPFALGCVAAAGAGGGGIAALLGTALGAVAFLDFQNGLPHIAAAILLCTASTALHGTRLWKKPLTPPLCAAGLFLAVKGIYIIQAADPLGDLLPYLTAAALIGVSTWCYAPLLRGGGEELRPGTVRFLSATAACAFTRLGPGGMDAGRILAAALAITTAWQEGSATGIATGLGVGFLMDLCAGGGAPFYTAAYGLGGFLAGTRMGRSRISAAAAFACGAFFLTLPLSGTANRALAGELLISCVLVALLPARLFGGKRLQRPQTAEPATAADRLKTQMTRAAAAFRDLCDSVGRIPGRDTEENPAVIFDRAAERVCRGCALCSLCWKQEYVATFNALNDATPFLIERGRAMPKDFPRHFSDRCIHLPEFLTAVNTELSAYLLRGQYRRQLEESRRSAKGQYAQLSELLSATAAGLGETRTVAAETGRPYRIGAALRPKEGESVCGDSVSSFETDTGLLCLILSDGCGSGESARKESALTNRLLRQFLEAGIEPEAALKTMNAALALRSEESGSFSTIDLLTVVLRTGEASLYKYGAAPTYIKKRGSVRRITGSTLPAGLREAPAPPDVTHLPLEEGSYAVMVSDGIADALSDEWLQNFLAGWDGGDPQALAGLVLQEAVARGALSDDCAVQALLLEENPTSKRAV